MDKTYTEINKERILNQNLATAFMFKNLRIDITS